MTFGRNIHNNLEQSACFSFCDAVFVKYPLAYTLNLICHNSQIDVQANVQSLIFLLFLSVAYTILNKLFAVFLYIIFAVLLKNLWPCVVQFAWYNVFQDLTMSLSIKKGANHSLCGSNKLLYKRKLYLKTLQFIKRCKGDISPTENSKDQFRPESSRYCLTWP